MFCLFKKPKYMIIIGPQNSGKGSQARFTCEKYNIVHISTGDILRENIAKKTPLGLEAQKLVDKGILVSDEIIINLIKNRLKEKDAKNGALFDGFPRTLAQAEALVKLVDISAVINLNLSDEIAISRGLNRRTCDKCKKISMVDKISADGKCECGGKFVVRADDNEKTLKSRLKTFHEQTEPIVTYFKDKKNKKGKNILLDIDGAKTIPDVAKDVETKLAELYK